MSLQADLDDDTTSCCEYDRLLVEVTQSRPAQADCIDSVSLDNDDESFIFGVDNIVSSQKRILYLMLVIIQQ